LAVTKIICTFVLYKRGVMPCKSFMCSYEFSLLAGNSKTFLIMKSNLLTKIVVTVIVCTLGALLFAGTYNDLAGIFAVVATFLTVVILYAAFFYHKK